MNDLHKILEAFIEAGKKASKKILEIYNTDFEVMIKDDSSPVTQADLNSDKIIFSHLSIFSNTYYLSEEKKDDLKRLDYDEVFIVDPLDGTSDFVSKDDSFSINMAYCYKGEPYVALIYLPVYDSYCYAIKGEGSYLVKDGNIEKIHVSDRVNDLIFLASKTHENQKEKDIYLKHADRFKSILYLGASIKGIYVASSLGDCSIRYTDMTKEWDVCAMDLIVREAGGIFLDTKLNKFTYNKKDVYNHDGYVMLNRKENLDLL